MKLLEHTLLSTLQNEDKMVHYLQQFGDRPSSIDSMIWQVHFSVPAKKRMKILNTFFDQLLKKYRILYSFLPEQLILAKVFKLLNIPYTVSSTKTFSSSDYISRKKLPKSPRVDRYMKIYNTVHKKESRNDLGLYEYNESRPGPFVPYTEFRKECKSKKSEKLTAENVLNQLLQAKNEKSTINKFVPKKIVFFSKNTCQQNSSTKTLVPPCILSTDKCTDAGVKERSYRIFKEKNKINQNETNSKKTCSRTSVENVVSKNSVNSINPVAQFYTANSNLIDLQTQDDEKDSSKMENDSKSSDESYLEASKAFNSMKSIGVSKIGRKVINKSPGKISNENGESSLIVEKRDIDQDCQIESIDLSDKVNETTDGECFTNNISFSTNLSYADSDKSHSFNSLKDDSNTCRTNDDMANELNVCETISNNASKNLPFESENLSSLPRINDSEQAVQDTVSESVLPAESNVSTSTIQNSNRMGNKVNYAVCAEFNSEIVSNETFVSERPVFEKIESQSNTAKHSITDEKCGNSVISAFENSFIPLSSNEKKSHDLSSFSDGEEKIQDNASCEEIALANRIIEPEKNTSSIENINIINSSSEVSEILPPQKSSLIITRRSSAETDSTTFELSNSSADSFINCTSKNKMTVENLSYFTQLKQMPMLKEVSRKQNNLYSNQKKIKVQKTKSLLSVSKKLKDKCMKKNQRKMAAKLTDFVAHTIRKRVSNQITVPPETDIVEQSESENEQNFSNDILKNYLRKTMPRPSFKKRPVKKLFNETAEQWCDFSQNENLKPTPAIKNFVEVSSSASENGEVISDSTSYSSLLNEEFKTLSLNSSESSVLFTNSSSQKNSVSSNTKKSQASSKYISESKFSPQITWDQIDKMMKGIPCTDVATPILRTENLTAKISKLNKSNIEFPALRQSASQPEKNYSTLRKNKPKRSVKEFDSDTSDEDIFRHASFRSLPISYEKKPPLLSTKRRKSSLKENIWKNNENSTLKKNSSTVANKQLAEKNKNCSPAFAATLFSPKLTQNFSSIQKPETSQEKQINNYKKFKNSNKLGILSDDDYESEDLDSALNDSISYLNKWKEKRAAKHEDTESNASRNYDDEMLLLLNEYEALNAEQQPNLSPPYAENVTSFESTAKKSNFDSNVNQNSQNLPSVSSNYQDILWNSYPDSLETALTTANEKLNEVRNDLRKKYSDLDSQQSINFNKNYKSSKDSEIDSFSFLDWD